VGVGVSVIVPIFNGLAHLPGFFTSLAAALLEGSQVILVDDGSTQPVFDAVPELPRAGEVVQLRNELNLGYCAAVNRAFEIATGEIIVQLNTDLVLEASCITAMIDLIAAERDVGIVGSKLLYPTTGLVQHIGMAFGDHSHKHVYMELPADHPLCLRTREMQFQTSATAAMTRRVLDRIGPLDEAFYNANDDLDHCLKAHHAGFRNFTCADSVAHHWESQSGPARFAGRKTAEALFWARWGGRHEVDLGRFVDEALDVLLDGHSELEGMPFHVLDLTRGGDQPLVFDRLAARWPDLRDRVRRHRQVANDEPRLRLPLVLPHWVATEPVPFVYMVDRYRELEDNALWFAERRRVVREELVVDLTGVVLTTTDAFPPGP
jgi:GT2 family glycosyltransferase